MWVKFSIQYNYIWLLTVLDRWATNPGLPGLIHVIPMVVMGRTIGTMVVSIPFRMFPNK